MATTVSDTEMIAILAEMWAAPLPIYHQSSHLKDLVTLKVQNRFLNQPPQTTKNSTEWGYKDYANRLCSLETRRVKCKRPCKSWENTRETPRVHTACSTDLSHTSDSTAVPDLHGPDLSDIHAELLTLMIKEQEKNLLQTTRPSKPSSSSSRTCAQIINSQVLADGQRRARPRMRQHKNTKNTKKVQQQNCNFANMQAQLSELQKMFCKMSETMNVNKNRVEQYSMVCFTDSRGPKRNTIKGNNKRTYRRNSLKKNFSPKQESTEREIY